MLKSRQAIASSFKDMLSAKPDSAEKPIKEDPTRFLVGRHGRKGHVVVYGVKGEKYGRAN